MLRSPRGCLTSFGKRLAGTIVDGIVVAIPTYILVSTAFKSGNLLTAYALGFVVGLLYYTWGYGSSQTLGCMLLGMRIVDAQSGEAPGYGKGAVRYVASLILGYLIVGLLGDLWMLWDGKK